MNIVASCKSDIGTFRKENQDSFTFLKNKTGQFLAVICDGLGGHKCGNIASSMAVSILQNSFNKAQWQKINTDEQIEAWLKTNIETIQQAMYEYSSIHEEANDMGTTMVVTLISLYKAYVVNIGDSRVYLFNENGLKQLTSDHNILNLYLKDNPEKITEIDINKTYWKSLTSALGPTKSLTVDIFSLSITTPSYFLLTTDGVHDFLEQWEISHILKKNSNLKTKVKILIRQALSNISTDNLTAMLILVKD